MKTLLLGYGKMGEFIAHSIKRNKRSIALTVLDICFEAPYEKEGTFFINDINQCDLSTFNCAFISTPASTHFDLIKRLIHGGVKNIYVEKPAVMNKIEFDGICEINAGYKIVCGYILRQSEPMFALKHIINKMIAGGFQLELCSVTYQKYLPSFAETRANGDIGVFEEIVHIWDLLFNYLDFKAAQCKVINTLLELEEGTENRTIYAQLSYFLNFSHSNALLQLTSSFKAKEKRREFFFTFKNGNGYRRNITLSFDNANGLDSLIVNETKGRVLYEEDYPSLDKLDHQVDEVFHHFETGEHENLSLFEESATVIDLLEKAGIYL